MKVLITGGAGYIGSHCARLLEANGIETVTFDNLEHGYQSVVSGAFYLGDLRSTKDLTAVFSSHHFDAVMHFAALIEVEESVREPGRYMEVNALGTLNLLEAMRRADVGTLVFSSTAAVYGDPEQVPINETHRLAPLNPYGLSKMVAEQMIEYYQREHSFKSVMLRYFNAAGREFPFPADDLRAHDTHLITRVLNVAGRESSSVDIFGSDYPTADGTCVRDYVHVRDISRAHLLALRYLAAGRPNAVFNVGNGRGYSVSEVIEACRAVTKLPIPAVRRPRRPGDPATLVASNAALHDATGWTPEFKTLESVIESAWCWHGQTAPLGGK